MGDRGWLSCGEFSKGSKRRPRIHTDERGFDKLKRSLAIYPCDPCKSVARFLSGCGDSLYQVFLLILALGADGESVEDSERERIL